jgi:hypothetical protein
VVFPYLTVLFLHLSEDTKGNHENLREDSSCSGRDSDRVPVLYKLVALLTKPTYPVIVPSTVRTQNIVLRFNTIINNYC